MKEKVIIRTYSAGVHFGTLIETERGSGGTHVVLENSRRIWKWSGANSLSELATIGTQKPNECNFSLPVKKIELLAIEIIYMTPEAIQSIESVPYWAFGKSQDITEVLNKNNLK
ncbi:MAG TPA: hypothetical protein PLN85_03535 [archaeon]|nr:hypothetical protein [archaeon]